MLRKYGKVLGKSQNGRASAAKAVSGSTRTFASKGVKRVYFFGNGKAEGGVAMKDLLGGKGANLADMTLAGLPVPAGFTITTQTCKEYNDLGQTLPKRDDGGGSREPRQDGKGLGQAVRRSEKSAARRRPLWGESLHARHDGHGAEHRPER